MGEGDLSVNISKPAHFSDPELRRMWETPEFEVFLNFYFKRYVPVKAVAVVLTAELPEEALWREFNLFDDFIDLGDEYVAPNERLILNTSWNDLMLATLVCHRVVLEIRWGHLDKFIGYNPLKAQHWGSDYLTYLRKRRTQKKAYNRCKRQLRRLKKRYHKDREDEDQDRLPMSLLEEMEAVQSETEKMLEKIRPSDRSAAGGFLWQVLGVVTNGLIVFFLAALAVSIVKLTGGLS